MKNLWIIENNDFKTDLINSKNFSKKYKIQCPSTFYYRLNVEQFGLTVNFKNIKTKVLFVPQIRNKRFDIYIKYK